MNPIIKPQKQAATEAAKAVNPAQPGPERAAVLTNTFDIYR